MNASYFVVWLFCDVEVVERVSWGCRDGRMLEKLRSEEASFDAILYSGTMILLLMMFPCG